MSNGAPNINPTGTEFKDVVVYAKDLRLDNNPSTATITKAYTAMMKIVGEYIKADYDVRYREERRHGVLMASAKCRPPLFADGHP